MGEVTVRDWQAAGLLKPSAIKPVIATIEHTLVIKRLGRQKEQDQTALRKVVAQMIG